MVEGVPKTENGNRKTSDERRETKLEGLLARWMIAVGMAMAFVVLAVGAHRVGAFAVDVRVTRWVQGHDSRPLEWVTTATNWSMSGTPLTIGAIVVALGLLLRGWRQDAAALALATAIRAVNSGLKEIVESPRPTPDLVRVTGHASGYGYPSGHAAGALLVVGALTWIVARHVKSRAWRAVIRVAAGAWIVLTGVGRVRVGVHWPTDVLGAWLWSIPALIVITWVAGRRRSLTG
jgi:undecaprenyl-diphosphatase